jgi:hypothetical protein
MRSDEAPTSEEQTTMRNAKIWLFEVISLVSFTAAIVIFAADFAFGFDITWSVFPLASIVFVWLFISAFIALVHVPVVLVAGETILLIGFLLSISLFAGGFQWFNSLGLPIAGLSGFFTAITVLVIRLTRPAALPAIGISLLGIGFLLVGLELVLNNYLGREEPVSWSLVAFACTVSVFFLMLFINKRLKEHHSEFRRIFHI